MSLRDSSHMTVVCVSSYSRMSIQVLTDLWIHRLSSALIHHTAFYLTSCILVIVNTVNGGFTVNVTLCWDILMGLLIKLYNFICSVWSRMCQSASIITKYLLTGFFSPVKWKYRSIYKQPFGTVSKHTPRNENGKWDRSTVSLRHHWESKWKLCHICHDLQIQRLQYEQQSSSNTSKTKWLILQWNMIKIPLSLLSF